MDEDTRAWGVRRSTCAPKKQLAQTATPKVFTAKKLANPFHPVHGWLESLGSLRSFWNDAGAAPLPRKALGRHRRRLLVFDDTWLMGASRTLNCLCSPKIRRTDLH